jgi:hypothetical protein
MPRCSDPEPSAHPDHLRREPLLALGRGDAVLHKLLVWSAASQQSDRRSGQGRGGYSRRQLFANAAIAASRVGSQRLVGELGPVPLHDGIALAAFNGTLRGPRETPVAGVVVRPVVAAAWDTVAASVGCSLSRRVAQGLVVFPAILSEGAAAGLAPAPPPPQCRGRQTRRHQ